MRIKNLSYRQKGLLLLIAVALALVGLAFAGWRVVAVSTAPLGSDRSSKIGVFESKDKPKAPDFSLVELMSGRPISLEGLRGKVVFLNFWATWCLPCQWEMPEMEKLYQAYREKGLVVLAVSLDHGPRAPREFIRQKGLSYPAILDEGFKVAQSYGVRGLPTSIFIDRKGRIFGVAQGPREWFGKEAKEFIEGLLREG